MRAVYTTMRPAVPIEVDDAEYLDLKRQGLLLPGDTGLAPAAGGPADVRADTHIDQMPHADPAELDHEENPA